MGYWKELAAFLSKDPPKFLRYLVLFICSIVVIVQLTECLTKLVDPPISTHSSYSVNETIEMPAVTICRDPPYKQSVLSNLSQNNCSHPKYNTCWNQFPFNNIHLLEFFMNSSFNQEETFVAGQYGLNGLNENVYLESSLHFYMGQCHTIKPRIEPDRANKMAGYSILLSHHISNLSHHELKMNFESEPGWHIFIHDKCDPFSEINMKASGRVEYVFAHINEEVEIKLQSQYFQSIDNKHRACSIDDDYSDLKCCEVSLWQELVQKLNCSLPWMEFEVKQNVCSTYQSMKRLTSEYGLIYDSSDAINCDCIQPCKSHIYSAYIQNRRELHTDESHTQIWIYYTTKLVALVVEHPGYDTTQFIADMGGSLGFLLGLSVLSLIRVIEHALAIFFNLSKKYLNTPASIQTNDCNNQENDIKLKNISK